MIREFAIESKLWRFGLERDQSAIAAMMLINELRTFLSELRAARMHAAANAIHPTYQLIVPRMFENLSDREKKLALAVGALVPIAIVFFGIFRMQAAFKTNADNLQSLDLQIAQQEELELRGHAR